MKFQITRTSLGVKESKPCEEAFKLRATYLDYRTKPLDWFRSRLKDRGFKEFLTQGKNHRNIKVRGEDWCVRELEPRFIWVVEIKNLKELIVFQRKYDGLIIQKSGYKEITLEIEIYDYYRE